MVSLKCSGREIPALINHLQIILVQTLSVQIDNGYLIQKKCLVSQKFCGGCWKMVKQNKKGEKKLKKKTLKNPDSKKTQPKLKNSDNQSNPIFNSNSVIICYASWEQSELH